MENNIFMFKKTGLYPLQTDITGSSTEELGRYNITKKNGPSIEPSGTPQRMFRVPVFR